jgi:hypothetical protein
LSPLQTTVGRLPGWQISVLCLAFTLAIGLEDYLTSAESLSALLYLIPVALGAWFVGRPLGLVLSAFCAVMSYRADWPKGLLADQLGQVGILVGATILVSLLKGHDASERAPREILQSIIDALPATRPLRATPDSSIRRTSSEETTSRRAGVIKRSCIVPMTATSS